jgi:hypothetical protein
MLRLLAALVRLAFRLALVVATLGLSLLVGMMGGAIRYKPKGPTQTRSRFRRF